jgi:hypothetical protein
LANVGESGEYSVSGLANVGEFGESAQHGSASTRIRQIRRRVAIAYLTYKKGKQSKQKELFSLIN